MIVIVDYGIGNVGSILNMMRKIGAEATISAEPADIQAARKLVLAGVGAFDAGMQSLVATGLIPLLERKVLREEVPILGICLGLQLFGTGSDEGTSSGLGWIDATSERFKFPDGNSHLRIPHIGWNTVTATGPSELLEHMDEERRFYFVHSYHLRCAEPEDVVATTHYGYDFPAVVKKRNIMGTQFHPEKSHRYGLQLLKNFLAMS
jgi:glutamine amidotransferase